VSGGFLEGPGGTAHRDQSHARALDILREADGWVLFGMRCVRRVDDGAKGFELQPTVCVPRMYECAHQEIANLEYMILDALREVDGALDCDCERCREGGS